MATDSGKQSTKGAAVIQPEASPLEKMETTVKLLSGEVNVKIYFAALQLGHVVECFPGAMPLARLPRTLGADHLATLILTEHKFSN